VYKDGLATEVQVQQESRELQSVFTISALARPGVDVHTLEKAIDEEVAQLKAKGPTPAELEAARTLVYTGAARRLESLLSRAQYLNFLQLTYGPTATVKNDLDRYAAATPKSLQDMANQVFTNGRVVVDVRPEPKVAQAQEAK